MQPGVAGGDVEVWLESFHGLYGRMEAQEVFPIRTSKVLTFSSDFNLHKNTSGKRRNPFFRLFQRVVILLE